MTQKLIVNCTTGERSVEDYTAEEEAAATAAGEAQTCRRCKPLKLPKIKEK